MNLRHLSFLFCASLVACGPAVVEDASAPGDLSSSPGSSAKTSPPAESAVSAALWGEIEKDMTYEATVRALLAEGHTLDREHAKIQYLDAGQDDFRVRIPLVGRLGKALLYEQRAGRHLVLLKNTAASREVTTPGDTSRPSATDSSTARTSCGTCFYSDTCLNRTWFTGSYCVDFSPLYGADRNEFRTCERGEQTGAYVDTAYNCGAVVPTCYSYCEPLCGPYLC